MKEQLGVDLDDNPEEHVQVTPEAAEETPPAADERPEWLPENYKTPEAFAEAHKSLQNELRVRGEREKTMREELDQLTEWAQQVQQAPQQQQYDQGDPLAVYAQELELARENGDTLREAQLQAWLTQYNIQQAYAPMQQGFQQAQAPQLAAQNELFAIQAKQTMSSRYDDWDEVEPRIAEMLERDPDLLPDRSLSSLTGMINALDRTYQLVTRNDYKEQVEQMREAGISQADIDRARKLRATTMSGSSGQRDQPSEVDQQLAEMQRALHGSSYEYLRTKGA
jgi:hypothetical protein